MALNYSKLVGRIAGERVSAWDIHSAALAAKAQGESVTILSVGDPDFATPEPMVQAAVAALNQGDTHYTEVPGRPALREAIASWHQRKTGQTVSAENVIVVQGAQNGLFCAALCVCESGDEVLVPEPMYLTYEATVCAAGATLVPVPCHAERRFHVDMADIALRITARTKAVFLANPCNPTGANLLESDLRALAELAIRHDLWVVMDEVYSSICFETPHLSLCSFPGMAERCITVNSLSKSHAMPGWRLGWVVAPSALVSHMANLELCMNYGLPGFVQAAGLEAIKRYHEVSAGMCSVYRRRRDLAYRILSKASSLRCFLPEAGMFLMVNVQATGLTTMDFCWRLFRATGISVLDGSAFGASANGWIRLGFVVEDHELQTACDKIVAFAASVKTEVA